MNNEVKLLLDDAVKKINNKGFILNDPICVPHQFNKKQDIEIAGFFAATFAWGNRKTIINKTNELLNLMDHAPHDFILHHTDADLKLMEHFVHRTFNATDLFYFIETLHCMYLQNNSLENIFVKHTATQKFTMQHALKDFYFEFFNDEFAPQRTRKHIATPDRKSACKRLCMYLRWMVRDDKKVDFGIWKKIKSADLICPLDVHSSNIARRLNLLQRKQNDWQAAVELTESLKKFDALDPVKYDFALFGMGVSNI
ncbi:MAG: hypothetical protein RIQ33_2021 [Bacteroidota bacterium]|jgi:uncharacterized protein (TIGR02757 family)